MSERLDGVGRSIRAELMDSLEGRERNLEVWGETSLEELYVARHGGKVGKTWVKRAFNDELRLAFDSIGVETLEDLLDKDKQILEEQIGNNLVGELWSGIDDVRNTLLAGAGGLILSLFYNRPVEGISLEAEVRRDERFSSWLNQEGLSQTVKAGKWYVGWPDRPPMRGDKVAVNLGVKPEAIYDYLSRFKPEIRYRVRSNWYVPFKRGAIVRELVGINNLYDMQVAFPHIDFGRSTAWNALPGVVQSNLDKKQRSMIKEASISALFNLRRGDKEESLVRHFDEIKDHLRLLLGIT